MRALIIISQKEHDHQCERENPNRIPLTITEYQFAHSRSESTVDRVKMNIQKEERRNERKINKK